MIICDQNIEIDKTKIARSSEHHVLLEDGQFYVSLLSSMPALQGQKSLASQPNKVSTEFEKNKKHCETDLPVLKHGWKIQTSVHHVAENEDFWIYFQIMIVIISNKLD